MMNDSRKFWLEWLRPVVLVAAVILPFRSVIADWNEVPSGSMKPTIVEGDRIFVNKLAYGLRVPFTTTYLTRWDQPRRGDIAILFAPDSGTRLVKRVVGLPGDVLEVNRGLLVINGEVVPYAPTADAWPVAIANDERHTHILAQETLDTVPHHVMWNRGAAPGRAFGPVEIPTGHYFVMGDNRDDSRDSRWFGFVEQSQIVGRTNKIVASLDPERSYLPRQDRWLLDLR